MAQVQISLLPSRYEPLEEIGTYDETPNKDPAGAHVFRSGRTLLNLPATQMVLGNGGNPKNPEAGGIFWAGDPKKNEVAGRFVIGSEVKVTPVRFNARENTLVVYLNDIFRRFPQFRPTTDKWVTITEQTEEHKTFFVIQLTTLLHPKKGRSAAGGGAVVQA